jgi:hypothetical protein
LGAWPLTLSWATPLLTPPIFAALFIYCLRFAGWHWPRTEAAVWLLPLAYGLLAAGNCPPSRGPMSCPSQ